jgi:hypothetical protein
VDAIRWPGLAARLRGRRVPGLRYEPDEGYAVAEPEDRGEPQVAAER